MIGTVRDIIGYMKSDGSGGIVLGIDWKKTFDTVEHTFFFCFFLITGEIWIWCEISGVGEDVVQASQELCQSQWGSDCSFRL